MPDPNDNQTPPDDAPGADAGNDAAGATEAAQP